MVIALGSNRKGPWPSSRDLLEAAVARFRADGIDVLRRSSWWRSNAWPDPSEPDFLNGVAIVQTALDPHELMATLGRIEETFGRERQAGRNAPRTLDLDLVAYGRLVDDTSGLTVPHPRATERRFVMGPLAEIAPDWRHPQRDAPAAGLAKLAPVGRDAAPAP